MDHGALGRRPRDAAARVESADDDLPEDIDGAAIERLATAVKAVTAAGVAFEKTLTGLGWAVLEFAQRRAEGAAQPSVQMHLEQILHVAAGMEQPTAAMPAKGHPDGWGR